MALAITVRKGDFAYTEDIYILTPELVKASRDIFSEYCAQGILVADDYMSAIWRITDEVHKYSVINLSIDELYFKKFQEKKFGCSIDDVKTAMRVVLTSELGMSVSWLQHLVTAMRNFINQNEFDPNTIRGHEREILSLLRLLPSSSNYCGELIENVEDYLIFNSEKQPENNQRTLAYYQSYLRFDDYIKLFWSEATDEQRKLYFPVYLWWQVTMIIPLRPTEFTLTPRSCVVFCDKKYYIRLRRTKLKGSWKALTYTIDGDYQIEEYNIPEKIAEEIIWYQRATDADYESDIDTLFCKHTQFNQPGITNANDNHYSYANLGQCLRRFYSEILVQKYGLQIVDVNREGLASNEIGRTRLGDTRHIALINLVLSGASLSACKELAGHQSFGSAEHYYGNIKKFLDAFTLCHTEKKILLHLNTYFQTFKRLKAFLCRTGSAIPRNVPKETTVTVCVQSTITGILGTVISAGIILSEIPKLIRDIWIMRNRNSNIHAYYYGKR